MSGEGERPAGAGENPRQALSVIELLAQWNRENPPRQYLFGETMADYMFGRVFKLEDDIRRYGDAFSRETAWKVKWAYLALALPYMFPVDDENLRQHIEAQKESLVLNNYDRMRKEQIARGEDNPGIELSFTQVKTLQFVLDEAEVPIRLGNAPLCVLLYPLEHAVQSAEFAFEREQREGMLPESDRPSLPPRETPIDFVAERAKRLPPQ